jgi:hypothetical protein
MAHQWQMDIMILFLRKIFSCGERINLQMRQHNITIQLPGLHQLTKALGKKPEMFYFWWHD